ncbi:MAG: hypothetical protein IGS39_26845 [Calothrix sp. C42_A2020_038]|nr:hypothetical protein [Calothrix sp. C42_A2020_038]
MKRLIAVSISVFILFAANNPANAQTRHGKEVSVSPTVQQNTSSRRLTPFHLVSLSYQGYLKNQGIPSYGSFVSEYHQSYFDARELVKAGIRANLLPADALTNQAYINAVSCELLAFSS